MHWQEHAAWIRYLMPRIEVSGRALVDRFVEAWSENCLLVFISLGGCTCTYKDRIILVE